MTPVQPEPKKQGAASNALQKSRVELEGQHGENQQVSGVLTDRVKALEQIAWMLSGEERPDDYDFIPAYGDLSEINQDGLIKSTISREQLINLVSEYLALLETSAAIYEINGDYALGIFSSGWCKMMDAASRRLCHTTSNVEALESGRWLCHESCWKDASRQCIQLGQPVDIACNGGIHLYAVPVHAEGRIIGAINFGYGSPPTDDQALANLAKDYHLPIDALRQEAQAYPYRPPFVIEYAKIRCQKAAHQLGWMIEHAQVQEALRETTASLQSILDHSPTIIIEMAEDGTYLRMNQAAASLFNEKPENLVGKNIRDLLPEDIVNRFLTRIEKIIQNKTSISVEDTFPLSGGEHTFLSTLFPLYDADGVIHSIGSIAQDITDRKRHEDELRVLKDQLQDQVNEKTAQLRERVAELEDFYNATIEREFRMQELREEIEQLKTRQDGS